MFNVDDSTASPDRASRGTDSLYPELVKALIMERFRMAETVEEPSSLNDFRSGIVGVGFMISYSVHNSIPLSVMQFCFVLDHHGIAKLTLKWTILSKSTDKPLVVFNGMG